MATSGSSASNAAHNPAGNVASGMRQEIASKWNKFSPAEIAALKNKDDLVTHLMNKYSLDRAQAQRDVEAFARGRQL
jgi:hypothetical protein